MSTAERFVTGKEAKNGRLSRFWSLLNWTDRMLLGWYLALGVALLGAPRYRSSGLHFFPQHILMASMILLLAILSGRGRWFRFAHDWYPIFVFVAAFEETARLSLIYVPAWRDAVILRAEAAVFSTPPTVWINRWHSLLMTEMLEFGYFTFYWIMPVVGGILYPAIWRVQSPETASAARQPFRIWMDATVLGYLVCYNCYLLFPTEGPAHTLLPQLSQSAGPFHWLVLLIQRHGGVHGNAFPSGHIMASTVALLAAWRWIPRLGKILAFPVLLMCIGAVYDRYHYSSDILGGAVIGATAFYVLLVIRRANRAVVA
jgi:membrane-associated phospholipid phosphatase